MLTPKKKTGSNKKNPDHSRQIARINRIVGQLNGIKRMVENQEYCPNILIQTQAAKAAIKSLEVSILEKHLQHCVHQAFTSKNSKESQKKIDELLQLYQRSAG